MASQRDPNRYAVMCYVPIELAAKIKSYAYGKTVVNKHREGEKVHTPTRPMAMSDLLIALAETKLKNQEVLPQFRRWGCRARGRGCQAAGTPAQVRHPGAAVCRQLQFAV